MLSLIRNVSNFVSRSFMRNSSKHIYVSNSFGLINVKYFSNKQEPTETSSSPGHSSERNILDLPSCNFLDDAFELKKTFPDVLAIVTKEAAKYKLDEKWLTKIIEYNVLSGPKFSAYITSLTYKSLVGKDPSLDEKLVYYLGWCQEMVGSFFLIHDDIIDSALIRYEKPCWYQTERVGLRAVNDAGVILGLAFTLLREEFSHLDCYVDLMETLNYGVLSAHCGQATDTILSGRNISTFTPQEYKNLIFSKTAYPALHMPFHLAMHLARYNNNAALAQTSEILTELGNFKQIENDFFDCFGPSNLFGKTGMDIEDNRCTWLAIKCLERANREQKTIMQNYYGKKDEAKVAKIKELYENLELPGLFAAYKKDSYDAIEMRIQNLPKNIPKHMFQNLLEKLY